MEANYVYEGEYGIFVHTHTFTLISIMRTVAMSTCSRAHWVFLFQVSAIRSLFASVESVECGLERYAKCFHQLCSRLRRDFRETTQSLFSHIRSQPQPQNKVKAKSRHGPGKFNKTRVLVLLKLKIVLPQLNFNKKLIWKNEKNSFQLIWYYIA